MPSKVDAAGLRALVKLVEKSVNTIIAEYEKEDAVVPTLNTLVPGPFDLPEDCTPTLEDALMSLEGACGQLTATCSRPGHTVLKRALWMYNSASYNTVLNAKVADIIGDSPKGMHVAELAKKTGVDEGKLARIMRFLASTHIFVEVKPNVFANNRLSVKMLSADPVSSILEHWTDDCLTSCSKFSETLGDPTWTSADGDDRAPFARAFGKPLFDYFKTEEGKFRGERFNRAMVGGGQIAGGSGPLARFYPWSEQPEGTRICDIGGGNGYIMLGLLQAHSHLRAVVQDMEPVMEAAEKFWEVEYPEAIKSQRIDFKAIDFFKDTPIKGCDYYFMRHIIHDWSDSDSIKILNSIRSVMGPSSKLLIQDYALPSPNSGYADLNAGRLAPRPLLPNYGMGNLMAYQMDVHMLDVLNAKERTVPEFEHIGREAGLQVSRVFNCGEMSLFEMIPA